MDERKQNPGQGAILPGEWERRRRTIDSCPVAPSDQRWIESGLTSLNELFGLTPHDHPPVLPSRDFYPVAYDGQELEVHELTRKLCGAIGVGIESLRLRLVEESTDRAAAAQARSAPYSGHFGAGTVDPESGLYTVDLDRSLAQEPPVLTAVIVHELAHVRLHAAHAQDTDHVEDGEPRDERLEQQADLLAIAVGLGLFGANVSFRMPHRRASLEPVSLGRMDRAMYGYALACWSWLRDEPEPQWSKTLGQSSRLRLDKGLRYLARAAGAGSLPTVR